MNDESKVAKVCLGEYVHVPTPLLHEEVINELGA
jgi:hypothetical protein